jgi:acyl-CoA thioesterase YciA
MSEPYVAIQVVMMPRDTNPNGTIFGGVILSYIDMAGAIAARRELYQKRGHSSIRFVTVAVNRVEFKQPVHVGDVVRFETTIVKMGRTSMTVHINVLSEREGKIIPVTESEVVYVGIDENRQPTPLMPA